MIWDSALTTDIGYKMQESAEVFIEKANFSLFLKGIRDLLAWCIFLMNFLHKIFPLIAFIFFPEALILCEYIFDMNFNI